jgi:hypothetical protein
MATQIAHGIKPRIMMFGLDPVARPRTKVVAITMRKIGV